MNSDARRPFCTAAMAGVAIYVGVDIVLQRLPPHYSVIRDAESNLAVGPYGWIMNLNFLGRAATTLCVMRAVVRTAPVSGPRSVGALLLGIGGASSAVLAFFPTDVRSEAGAGPVATTGGAVHLIVAGMGFLAALAGVSTLTWWLRHSPGLRRTYRVASVFTGITALGLVSMGVSGRFLPGFLGLAERIALAGILGWAFAVSAGIRALPASAAQPYRSVRRPATPRPKDARARASLGRE
ncbi:MAG: DUF998 domain-containing protein [Actinomycetota bacterium]|nr:DUF998 domain-containing protein [Actinomycetota bacterium]